MMTTPTTDLDIIKNVLAKYPSQQCFLLFDENTLLHCYKLIIQALPELSNSVRIVLPAGEGSKTLEKCKKIWNSLLRHGAGKNALLINIGGGMITDIGGFCAANYKRGIEFMNMPTSLLSMIDASIGGKTGINLKGTKNQIGIFANPICIYINVDFLASLPKPELHSGMVEMIKHELLFNKQALTQILKRRSAADWIAKDVILQNIDYKLQVVQQDYYDKKERQFLNFGHTIGHALESYHIEYKRPILHGEAVLLGMIEELKLAEVLFYCPSEVRLMLQDVKKKFFPHLDNRYQLAQLLPYLRQDKKNDNQIRFSLLKNVAEPVAQVGISIEQIENVLS